MRYYTGLLVIVTILGLMFSTGCQAGGQSGGMPEGCVSGGHAFSGNKLIINDGTGGVLNLYLIHNISKDTLYLNHEPKDNPGASAGWSTELAPGNWAAISIQSENFGFTCGKMVPGKFTELDCKNDLKACRFANAEFSKEAEGSYWVSENKPLEETMSTIKSRGITVSK